MTYDAKEVSAGSLKGQEKLQRFKDWLRLSQDAFAAQRAREREDLRFQISENQWDDAAKTARKGRPMLSVSLLHQPMQLVQNQASQARLAVALTAVNETADKEIADTLQGIYQRIQRDGLADQARLWAFDRAKQCGRGWYRIITKYDEDSSNPSDQEIAYERILHQENVFPDPSAEKPDSSDGRFIFVAAHMTCEAFHDAYPKAEQYGKESFSELLTDSPEWVRETDNSPLIAECFYTVTESEDVELEALEAEGGVYRRQKDKVTVRRAVLTGCEILEDEEWIGTYIPIIPVIGRELQPVDGQRRWEGMVRPARDGQLVGNYAMSSLVEDISRLSKAPYVGAAGQFQGFEKQWGESNQTNFPYLEYNPTNINGQPAPPPQPMQIDGTKMGLSMQLFQEAKGIVQVATAVYEPSLGEMGGKDQSGKAIMALQQQADAGTGNYLGNLGSISLPYEARVVLDLIPKIYDRPGRVTQVLGGEDEAKMVMLNAPYVMDPEGKPAPPPPTMPGMPPPQGVKQHNLADGKYSVAVTIGKSAQTRLQQGADEIGQILASDPSLMPIIGPTYFRFRDFPGSKEIADLLTQLREQTHPGLGKKDGQPTPEQLQAQVQSLTQELEQAKGAIAQASQQIATDQAKQQATLQKAEMDNQTAMQQAAMSAQSAQQKGEADAQIKMALEQFQAAHEVAMLQMEQRFEREMTQFKAAHDVGMAAAGGRTSKVTRDQSQESGEEHENESSRGQSRQPALPETEGEE